MMLALLTGAQAHAQVVAEDLIVDDDLVPRNIEEAFDRAQELFNTVDQADSVALFTQVIEALEPMALTGDEKVLRLLQTSLVQRAQANFNFGEAKVARADLVKLITNSPAFEIDRDKVSTRVAKLFDEVRAELVGFVEFVIDPADTEVRIQGVPLAVNSGPVPILAGSYSAAMRRPGFASKTVSFEVARNKASTVEAVLERTSAVISLRTRPIGARVFIDGQERTATSGTAGSDYVASGAAASYDRSEFSDRSFVEDLTSGQHKVEVRKAGFRTFSTTVEIDGLVDVPLGAVLLDQEAGALVLRDLPADAQVEIDGRTVRPIVGARLQTAEMPLAPGSYVLSVTRGVFGRYETTVDIQDRGTTEVAVRLRPALVLLGVLGKDDVGARKLRDVLIDAFQKENQWALLDRSDAARSSLEQLGLRADTLRELVSGRGQEAVDWKLVQKTLDERVPGSVYILGVLSDDLLANEASLWLWPAAPGPSQPELQRVRLDQPELIASLATNFKPALDPIRPTVGATFIDTPLAPGPVVVDIVPGGPANKAGIVNGDAVVSVAGVPVYSEAMFQEQFLRLEAGQSVALEIQRRGQTSKIDLTTGRSFSVIDLSDPARVAAPVAAALAAELQSASAWPRWVLQLNQAAILLHAGDSESAVRELREIDMAKVPGADTVGLNAGTIDYWLGVALEQAGPRYVDRAKEAYQRAAAATGARFLHDDGPRVAPRAWARLQRLVPQN